MAYEAYHVTYDDESANLNNAIALASRAITTAEVYQAYRTIEVEEDGVWIDKLVAYSPFAAASIGRIAL